MITRTVKEKEQSLKLSAAFRAMRKAGLTARRNFSCCQSCGCYEICDDKKSKLVYAFYHRQDEEDRRAGHDFYIAYGGTKDDELSQQAGDITSRCLKEAGLEVEWNGSVETRIKVKGFNESI